MYCTRRDELCYQAIQSSSLDWLPIFQSHSSMGIFRLTVAQFSRDLDGGNSLGLGGLRLLEFKVCILAFQHQAEASDHGWGFPGLRAW